MNLECQERQQATTRSFLTELQEKENLNKNLESF